MTDSQNNCKHSPRFIFYSLFQKKRTFTSNFFCSPPGGGGPKIHMVNYVNGSSTPIYIINREFFAPSPRGATNKFGIKCVFILE